jgi:GNAT superfamily N-acetyltransferase
MKGEWEEGLHPREPSGSKAGGRFTFSVMFPKASQTENEEQMTDDEVRAFTRQHFGRELSRLQVAQLAGAFEGTSVEMSPSKDTIEVWVNLFDDQDQRDPRPIGQAHRTIHADRIDNEHFNVEPGFQKRGYGLRLFAQQVDEAAELGYQSMQTQAVGSSRDASSNATRGWWAWARMGYDAPLSEIWFPKFHGPVSMHPRGAPVLGPRGERTVHELMATPEGAEWWRANGEGFSGTFDLRPGSVSMRMFNEYRRLKEAERGTRS